MTKKEQFWSLVDKLKQLKPNTKIYAGNPTGDKPYLKIVAPISEKTYKENFDPHSK